MSDVIADTKERMEKCIAAYKDNLSKVRTGRANPHILDPIKVDYFGVETPITQLAGVKVPEATMLVIEPWDKSLLGAIEKAIQNSDLGINPSNDGSSIRLPFPSPTEERRHELVKDCKALCEEAKVSIRGARRDANNSIDKDEENSEDEAHRLEAQVQKLTDSYIAQIDEIEKAKEAEVMEI